MKTLKYLPVLFVLLSCDFDRTVEYRIDDRLKPYVNKFYEEASHYGISLRSEDLTVGISDIGDVFGITYDRRNVIIDYQFFNFYSKVYSYEVEVILFHELGHALLKQTHRDHIRSIMNTSPNLRCLSSDKRVEMLEELFKPDM